MKKKVLSVLLASVMVLTVAGCGKTEAPAASVATTETKTETKTEAPAADTTAAPEEVTLKIWCPENQIEKKDADGKVIESWHLMDDMVQAFQAEHPEWKINYTIDAVGEDTAKEQVLQDVEAAADVFFFANDQLPELVDAGAIAKLGGSAKALVTDETAPSVAQTVTYNGDIYAIPFTHNTFFMFYDKTLLTEEDVKTVEGIVGKDTADGVYNFYLEAAGGWKTGCWFYGAGNTIYGADQVTFSAGADWNNATGVAVANYLIDLVNNKKVAFDGEISVSELAGEHKIGAWFDGAWNYDLYKGILGDDLGLAVIPTYNLNGEAKQLLGFYGSKAIGVNSKSKNPAVAVAFAAFLGNADNQLTRFVETAQVPANTTAAAAAEVQASELAAVIVDEAAKASIMQPISSNFGSRYWSNAGAILSEMRSGDFTKDNAQAKLDAFVAAMAVE